MLKAFLLIYVSTLSFLSFSMSQNDAYWYVQKLISQDKTVLKLGLGGAAIAYAGLNAHDYCKNADIFHPDFLEQTKKKRFWAKFTGACIAALGAGFFAFNEALNIFRIFHWNHPRTALYDYSSYYKMLRSPYWIGGERTNIYTNTFDANTLLVLPSASAACTVLAYQLGKSALEDYKKLN